MPACPHRNYLRSTALAALLLVAAVAGVNRVANPYGLFASDLMRGADKPETFTHLRLVKAAQVRHRRPQALILGSSRAETGLDPAHPAWLAGPVYNLGLSNASLYEIRRYFEHACALGQVRQAVMLLDFAAFLPGGQPAPDFTESRLAVRPDGSPGVAWDVKDLTAALLTWDALNGSLATLTGREGEKRYLPDGSRDAAAEDERVLAKGGAVRAFAAYESRLVASTAPSGGPAPLLGQTELGHLRAMLAMARKKGVDLRLAIAPMHVRYQEIQRLQGLGLLYEEWKRALVSLLAEEAGQQPAFPLHDFGVYTEETADAVPGRGLARYYYEASHFNKTLGNRVLDAVLKPADTSAEIPPGGFGHRLTASSIEAHLTAVREARDGWANSHADELAALEAMMPQPGKASLR